MSPRSGVPVYNTSSVTAYAVPPSPQGEGFLRAAHPYERHGGASLCAEGANPLGLKCFSALRSESTELFGEPEGANPLGLKYFFSSVLKEYGAEKNRDAVGPHDNLRNCRWVASSPLRCFQHPPPVLSRGGRPAIHGESSRRPL